MSPMSLMVERLFVGVRGLFQSFAAACKYMYVYFAVASLQPSDKIWGKKGKKKGRHRDK